MVKKHMEEEYNLYSKFDIQKHKENYINYLEVLILENGEVEYAVPSHQDKAVALACKNSIRQRRKSRTCVLENIIVIIFTGF